MDSNENNIFEEFFKRIGVKIDWETIDDLIVSDANIIRPIKGAAFEYIFDLLVNNNFDIEIKPGTGDTDIDRMFLKNNNVKITMQLKTCVTDSIKDKKSFCINLHKTHGLEKRPNNLYPMKWPCPICKHDGEEFPDFLLVLHPQNGILIIPKEKIPENKTYLGHYDDPVCFEWNSEWLNRWDLLGFPNFKGKNLERRNIPTQKKFPKLSKLVNLTDEEIISMMLKPENFRIIDMNLRGNLREPALVRLFKENKLNLIPPGIPYAKFDKKTEKGIRIQIKGPSKSMCDIEKNTLGVEVMGTHGKGAIRCYSESDFDFLGFVIDPQYINPSLGLKTDEYHFCIIPISSLPIHYKNKIWNTKDKIYPRGKFTIHKDSKGVFLMPSNNYNINVKFRGNGPWYIDKIPKEMN